MKKLFRGIALIAMMAVMLAGMQVVAFADDEAGEDETSEAGEAAPEAEEGEAETTAAETTENPETGAANNLPVAVASMAAVALLAGGAVALKRK